MSSIAQLTDTHSLIVTVEDSTILLDMMAWSYDQGIYIDAWDIESCSKYVHQITFQNADQAAWFKLAWSQNIIDYSQFVC